MNIIGGATDPLRLVATDASALRVRDVSGPRSGEA